MKLRELPMRVKSLFGGAPALEGQWRGPFSGMGHLGNMFELGCIEDGWQRGLALSGSPHNAIVMACIFTLIRVLSASYPEHQRLTAKGGRRVEAKSDAHRLLMRPNAAQNVIDFVGFIVMNLCLNGNCYYYIKRDERFNPVELIPLDSRQRRAFLTPDNALFYDLSPHADFANTLDFREIVPARDILHLKLPSHHSVLHGDSLITYAYGPLGINGAVQSSAQAFLRNMNRPSGILSTEQSLTASQMTDLRNKFDEVSRGMNQGKVPILGSGMKWQQMSINAHDSQLLDTYKASTLDICRVFGVPIQLLGQETNGAASSVSTLIGQFKAGSLLYMAELIEFGLEELFKFDHITDSIRFDFDNISRAEFGTEIDSLSKGVQNALFSPNEARNRIGLDAVPFGEDPRVQAQNVRLEDAKPAQVAPSSGKDEAPSNKPEPDADDTASKFDDPDYVKNKLQQLIKSARAEVLK